MKYLFDPGPSFREEIYRHPIRDSTYLLLPRVVALKATSSIAATGRRRTLTLRNAAGRARLQLREKRGTARREVMAFARKYPYTEPLPPGVRARFYI